MEKKETKFSLSNFVKFGSNNFSLILIVLGVFVFGFSFGSLWKGNKTLGSKTDVPAIADSDKAAVDSDKVVLEILSQENLYKIVTEIGVDLDKVESCFESGEMKNIVESQFKGGGAAGVRGTPVTILVTTDDEREFLSGALPYESFEQKIKAAEVIEKADSLVANMPAVTEDDHIRGAKNPKITLVEYSDFQCSFCKRIHPTLIKILENYGDDVAWVYRHYPLDAMHPNARSAAETSECVAKYGGNDKFWEFIDIIYERI